MKFSEFNFSVYLCVCVLLGRFLVAPASLGDAITALALLAAVLLRPMIDYLYPKRPELHVELAELQELVLKLVAKTDGIESDVTALKFGGAMRK